MRIIKLVAYNHKWPAEFEQEVTRIKNILSKNLMKTYHIGSTAIPGIQAKPVIDILLEVQSLRELDKHMIKLEELGYVAKGEYGIEGRRYFQKGCHVRTHHIHAFETGNPEINRHTLFVAFMNAHPCRVAAYEKLKIGLACKYKEEPDQYTQGKSEFIKSIDSDAMEWKYGYSGTSK